MMAGLTTEAMIWGFTTTTRSADDDFPTAFQSANVRGACYGPDGRFHVLDPSGKLWTHAQSNWTTESNKWWAAFTLRDEDNLGTGKHESGLSVKATFTMMKRANLTLTSPAIPDLGGTDDPDSVSWYLGRGASPPLDAAMWRNAFTPEGVTSVTIPNGLFGFGLPTGPTNNFPSAGAARITDAAGNTLMNSSGYMMAAPTGCVQMYAGATAPTGWLLCQGQVLSITTYLALYAVIGQTYPGGDGSTTFALPDMMGRFPIGASTAGLNPGASEGDTALAARSARQTHSHTHADNFTTGGAGVINSVRASGAFTMPPDAHTHTINGSVTANTIPQHAQLTLNFIIKI
jgi:microcystin-dependent protein